MTDIQGALGSVQMDRAAWIIDQRRRLAAEYRTGLNDLAWFHMPYIPNGYEHGYQAFVTLYHPTETTMENVATLHQQRNDLMLQLEARGVATRQGTHTARGDGSRANG